MYGSIPSSDVATANPKEDGTVLEDTYIADQPEVNTYYEKIYADPADTIFWYGFGQGIVQFFGNVNIALSAYLSDFKTQMTAAEFSSDINGYYENYRG